MKIIVTAQPSESSSKQFEFDFEDLNIDENEWIKLSLDQKRELIQKACDNLPEQPFWYPEQWITE